MSYMHLLRARPFINIAANFQGKFAMEGTIFSFERRINFSSERFKDLF